MIQRLRRAWRRITGHGEIEQSLAGDLRPRREGRKIRDVVPVSSFDLPPDLRRQLALILSPDNPRLQAAHDPPCVMSGDGCHCMCWHIGERRCCYCGLAEHEERDPLRREGRRGP